MNKQFLKNISNFHKKIFLIFCDFLIIIISLVIAFSLRLEELYSIFKIDIKVYLLFLSVFFGVFYIQNIYQILIRFFDAFSIWKIIKSIIFCFLILVPLNFLLYKEFYFPRSISFITPFIITFLILFHRIFINFLINLKAGNERRKNNILIIGINENNIELIKSIRQNPNYGQVKALVDSHAKYKKRELNGIKILRKEKIDEIINKYLITEIIIGDKALNKNEIKKLFEKYSEKQIRIKNLSNTKNYLNKFIDQTLTSNINFFDIIDRPKTEVNKKILEKKIKNKSILVTGGGGSIGSELCVEILKHKPKKIFILDISEINLFQVLEKIKKERNYKKNVIKTILGDCNDSILLKNFFKNIKLDEIYHAAAYKHVNFGEENAYSMIKNNIFGTKCVVDFALDKKIKEFIFISSDKAVNPKSTLGFTKRFGEKIIKNLEPKLNQKIITNFTIVRFGNVIGSSGSVIPIFLNQIENQSFLTVTNKNVQRYFMSINEAVQLVINASYLNKKGIKIFTLDMGKQIKIYEIAKRIIRLSGNTFRDKKNSKGDIEIKIIGLKKGEKISEELTLGKNLVKTSHPKIMECHEKFKLNNLDLHLKKIQNSLNLNLKSNLK